MIYIKIYIFFVKKLIKTGDHLDISPSSFRPTWTEINLNAIVHNIREFRRLLPKDVKIMAVLKADAYGHGAVEVADAAIRGGADSFAVAFLEEGIELREAGVRKPVLLIGSTPPGQASQIIKYNLTQTVFSLEMAEAISREAERRNTEVSVHVKVDTGMGRVGLFPREAVAFIRAVSRLPGIKIEGILTHLASADEEDLAYTYRQVELFNETVAACRDAGIEIPLVHAANSAGAITVPESRFNMIRLGISLYGQYPSEVIKSDLVRLKPVLSFKSRVVFLKKVPPGTCLSYGSTFTAERESVIATIPVGYADGFNRLLSNRGQVLVRGRRAPIVGRICMDYSMIDVTGIEEVQVGDEVVLYGSQGNDEITVDEVANLLETISYELLCAVDKRVSRFYVEDGKIIGFRNLLGRSRLTGDGTKVSAGMD